MKQTAVEWFFNEMENLRVKAEINNMDGNDFIIAKVKLLNQAKEKEIKQREVEYLKGFKDGKEYQIKLDELTFGSSKQIMSTDIPFTNKDIDEMMEILNRMQKKLTIKSE